MAIAPTLQKPRFDQERRPILWTREDAEKLAELGMIPERYELIEGVLYKPARIMPQERYVANTILKIFDSIFGLEYLLHRMPVTLTLPHTNDGDLEPDITVLNRREKEFISSDPTANDILMCVEVAYTSLTEDTTRKAIIYAQNGIAEYWIADVKKRQIIVHREPTSDGYHQIKIYTEKEAIAPLVRPEALISVGELVPVTETPTEQPQ